MRFKLRLLQLLLIVALSSGPGFAQDSVPPSHRADKAQQESLPDEDPIVTERRERIEKVMEKKANQDRQAQLKQDTEKLLQLSTELKQYVEKTNENVLSVNVIKKADEIEKLAHSVKEKMKGN